MIASKYTTTAEIKRLVWTVDGNGNDISSEGVVSSFKGHLQQASPELITNIGDRFTLSHLFWCSSASAVKEGDVLTINSERYGVRAIQDNSFIGINKHWELQLEKETDNNEA